jgi:F0F1-type ATP synthase assembly protein I
VKLIRRPDFNPDDQLGRGMDLALVTLVFTGIGYGIDSWLGTRPVFTIGLLVLAVIGQFVSMRYKYEAAMQQHEAARREAAAAAPRRSPDRSAA